MSLPCDFVSCPGLFYGTSATDGRLSRIRVPGGILTTTQFRVIADLADCGAGYIQITNRANVQLREITREITTDCIINLQKIGIAATIPEVDHLRNIMGSPTAGIDPDELIDTRSLIRELDEYISTSLDLAELSPKFSVGFDGGGAVSIGDRPNDIAFTATMMETSVYFRLKLNIDKSFDVLLLPKECLEVVAALTKVYLQHMAETENNIPHRRSRKPRVRDVVNDLGIERFFTEVEHHLSYPLRRLPSRDVPWNVSTKYQHIGVHPQKQKGLFYIGVVIPVGQISTKQMRGLADIAQTYGSGTLRLTPWQNLLLSDIPQHLICATQSQIENLGLHWSVTNIRSALVACAGNKGCAYSATDTKGHALALSEYLDKHTLDQPINIHFTGCEKSCAQHSKSDITLLGVTIEQLGETVEGYKVYVGEGDEKFGRELYGWIPLAELPPLIERLLQIYVTKRASPKESFREFIHRYEGLGVRG